VLDRDIRELLNDVYLNKYRSDGQSKVVPEMGLSGHAARIDIGVVNGELIGYEIKSDRDTLARLPGQLNVYCGIFDKITIICGSRYEEKLLEILPPYCGLYVAEQPRTGPGKLRHRREPKQNPERSGFMIASLLWHYEAKQLLKSQGLKGLSKLRCWDLWQLVADTFTLDEVSHHVRHLMKARIDWREQ
jgi:hypothetical protein